MIMNKLITGPWNLTDLKEVKSNGLKVFSCFHCGGGSTMGYKLAGYEVLGGVEIDPKMMEMQLKMQAEQQKAELNKQETQFRMAMEARSKEFELMMKAQEGEMKLRHHRLLVFRHRRVFE